MGDTGQIDTNGQGEGDGQKSPSLRARPPRPRKPGTGTSSLFVGWREDPTVLERLPGVERQYLAGHPPAVIARTLGLTDRVVQGDIGRVKQLWIERAGDDIVARRSQRIAELDEIKRLAMAAAAWDLLCERAVLFGGRVEIDGQSVSVERDKHGAAQYRGNKAAALQTARQAVMDAAKLEGLIVDKHAATDASGQALDWSGVLALAMAAEARQLAATAGATTQQPAEMLERETASGDDLDDDRTSAATAIIEVE